MNENILNKKFQPVIKWTGSKRSQCHKIVSVFPNEIDTYYEPFLGGGSVFRSVLDSDIKVKHYVCSDINKDLINLWNIIKNNCNELIESYTELWNRLNKNDDIEIKKEIYYSIRDDFNKTHSPYYFNFLLRESLNGMVRYNNKGEFNSPFHFTRKGIIPENFEKIVKEWNKLLIYNDVRFINCSYDNINPNKNDYVYLDPPYFNTKGLYYGIINFDNLWDWMKTLECNYSLSFDGFVGNNNMGYDVPKDLYSKHLYINSGKSSFRRIISTVKANKNENVYESLYIK